ncbi:OsmC family protein [Streptomyces netropsis]|uniref:OsmC family protein n=1 Tax=Streptomyces netropsis TaxID=55404 RepID=UPI0030CCEF40
MVANPAQDVEPTSAGYGDIIRELSRRGLAGGDLFFELALGNPLRAADLFLPVHERMDRVDSWVSLEMTGFDQLRRYNGRQQKTETADRCAMGESGHIDGKHSTRRQNMTSAHGETGNRAGDDRPASCTSDPTTSLPPGSICVEHKTGDTYTISVRGHRLVADQPSAEGGNDDGPTPTELFAASLASCVAFYAGRYLRRHGVGETGLRVEAEFAMADDRPARVSTVRLTVHVPAELDPQRHDALLAVASHCTVHNTLAHPPEIVVRLGSTPPS